MEFLTLREKMIRLSHEYETWILIIAKFIGMMFVFTYVNSELGYFALLENPTVNILLSLICSIIPGAFSVFLVAAVVVAHMVKLSVVLGALTLVVALIIYLLFLNFSPEQSAVILAVPVLMHFHLQFMIPVVLGLFLTPYAVIPAALGCFMVKFLGYEIDAVSLTGSGMSVKVDGLTDALSSIFNSSLKDHEVWMYAIVIAVTFAVIFIIGQFSFDYAWYAAIAIGAVVEIVMTFLCEGIFDSGISVVSSVISILIGAVIAAVLQFIKCPLDYGRKENVQFEDEDYYYYVKAIPKYTTGETAEVPDFLKKTKNKADGDKAEKKTE